MLVMKSAVMPNRVVVRVGRERGCKSEAQRKRNRREFHRFLHSEPAPSPLSELDFIELNSQERNARTCAVMRVTQLSYVKMRAQTQARLHRGRGNNDGSYRALPSAEIDASDWRRGLS